MVCKSRVELEIQKKFMSNRRNRGNGGEQTEIGWRYDKKRKNDDIIKKRDEIK